MQILLYEDNTNATEFVVSVGDKGQITVPQEIRTKLGMKPKAKVAIRLEHGEAKIKPIKADLASIFQMGGSLKQPLSDKELAHRAWEEQAQHVAREGL